MRQPPWFEFEFESLNLWGWPPNLRRGISHYPDLDFQTKNRCGWWRLRPVELNRMWPSTFRGSHRRFLTSFFLGYHGDLRVQFFLDQARRGRPTHFLRGATLHPPLTVSGLRFVDREKGFWRRWEVGFSQLTLLVEGRYIVVRHLKMDHARGLEDFMLKHRKRDKERKKERERERQREREREREREKRQTKEWERTHKCAEDTNNLLVKCQENFSLAEMQFSFLKLTFFYGGWATFCSKKLS